jgi:hypothetical protein
LSGWPPASFRISRPKMFSPLTMCSNSYCTVLMLSCCAHNAHLLACTGEERLFSHEVSGLGGSSAARVMHDCINIYMRLYMTLHLHAIAGFEVHAACIVCLPERACERQCIGMPLARSCIRVLCTFALRVPCTMHIQCTDTRIYTTRRNQCARAAAAGSGAASASSDSPE